MKKQEKVPMQRLFQKNKTFEAKQIEFHWRNFWEENGLFKMDPLSPKPPFTVPIPPPNVTGVLHMGHALVNTLQDVLVRWKRMDGFEVAWIPGTDHAGIATQTVVEKDLLQKYGKRRVDFTREEFLKHVWEWKEKNEHIIVEQYKSLGCSCDWSQLAFTMDASRSQAVRVLFKKMFDDGLIYQGDYLVNWDPVTQTALADDEVEYEDQEGALYCIKYQGEGNAEDSISVMTTRPETVLGDVAIAVHPDDERYKFWIGKNVIVPIVKRAIPVIADTFVDTEFGTGALKITPAHDHNDYQIGVKHNLPFINLMNPDGTFNEQGAPFTGLPFDKSGRAVVVKKLKEDGVLLKVVSHQHRVGVSYRSKAVIQPYLSRQWFVSMNSFKQGLLDAVRNSEVQLIPEEWKNTYFHWIDNLRDWCVSRQLWWGHRIPIWYRGSEALCYDGDGLPPEVAQNPDQWRQEEDVLDTWFSSGLWPFSVLGWPDNQDFVEKFYPASILVTGHDILFFWVARMIMMGKYVMNKVPFPKVFLHGLIYAKSYWREESGVHKYITGEERQGYDRGETIPSDVHFKWEKMSKSKGNVMNPLGIGAEYGMDSLRMTLCSVASHAQQIDLDYPRLEANKHFINKLWNASRFVLTHLEDCTMDDLLMDLSKEYFSLEDKWIINRLSDLLEKIPEYFDACCFDKAVTLLQNFFWDDFCSFYIEIAKPILFGKQGGKEESLCKKQLLWVVLTLSLGVMHSIIPFVTEQILFEMKSILSALPLKEHDRRDYVGQAFSILKAQAMAVAPFPQAYSVSWSVEAINTQMRFVQEVIYLLRKIRGEMKLPLNMRIDCTFSGSGSLIKNIETQIDSLKALVKVGNISFIEGSFTPPSFSSTAFLGEMMITVYLPEELQQGEVSRLNKELHSLKIQLEKISLQLSNDAFIRGAPEKFVHQVKTREKELLQQIEELEKKL